jgi:hypothetical protein
MGDEIEYEVWEPKYGIDRFVKLEFTTGACGYFAAALHDRTGWPIMAEYDHDHPDEVAHVFVLNPDGKAVDIRGIHDGDWAETDFSDPTRGPGPIHPMSREEAATDDGVGGYLEWANTILDYFPERYGISDCSLGMMRR